MGSQDEFDLGENLGAAPPERRDAFERVDIVGAGELAPVRRHRARGGADLAFVVRVLAHATRRPPSARRRSKCARRRRDRRTPPVRGSRSPRISAPRNRRPRRRLRDRREHRRSAAYIGSEPACSPTRARPHRASAGRARQDPSGFHRAAARPRRSGSERPRSRNP